MYVRDTGFFPVKQLSHSALQINLVRGRKKLRRKLGNGKQLNMKKST